MNEAQTNQATNSTDATIGQNLRTRVETRKAELEAALESPDLDKRVRGDVELAVNTVNGLLTGDLDNIPAVVAVQLNNWLETNKHLNERHDAPTIEPAPEATKPS